MTETKTLKQIQNSIESAETCVINLIAAWCSDCTDQSENLAMFAQILATHKVHCYSSVVQQEKNIYLSADHQSFTESVGGHGFPRTILIIKGKIVDADNVEIISSEQLTELANKFIQQL